jgi:hypothetical protein
MVISHIDMGYLVTLVMPYLREPATLGKSMAALLGMLGQGKLRARPYPKP